MEEALRKECHVLAVDLEFKNLIPPLTVEERNLLETSLLSNGCESPLFVWNGIIVDGHNRYEICRKHSMPFAVVEKDFTDREAALMWIIQTQLGRRNLTIYQKGELALRFEPLIKAQARERLATSTGGNAPRPTKNSAEAEKGETRQQIGKLAGVSHDTIKKVKKLAVAADDETKQKLRRGEISIHRAYTDLMKKEHDSEAKTCESCHQEKTVADFNIPSKHRAVSALCMQCETEVAAAAKETERVTLGAIDPVVITAATDHAPKNPHGHFSTLGELCDLPEHFPKVAELLRRTLDACYNGIDINLRQYKPSMVSDENTAALYTMIVSSYEETLEVFRGFMTRTYGKQM